MFVKGRVLCEVCYSVTLCDSVCLGKSTYCRAMAHHMRENMKRKVVVVNLDPANDSPPYEADVNVKNLVDVEEVYSLSLSLSLSLSFLRL